MSAVTNDSAADRVCPLCRGADTRDFYRAPDRPYRRCSVCALVFVPRTWHLSRAAEKAQYDLHCNGPSDAGYRHFLSRMTAPLAARLKPASAGLDFGSGPGPTLCVMLAELGHRVTNFDPFYAPDNDVLEQRYDFVTATEVVEHLSAPGAVLSQLWGLLLPGGWLGLMTQPAVQEADFGAWHYKNDPTHVTFFAHASFLWLGAQWGVEPQFFAGGVVLFHKQV